MLVPVLMSGVVSGWLVVDSAHSFVVSLAVVEGSGVFVGHSVAVVLVSMTDIVVAVVVAGTVVDVVV